MVMVICSTLLLLAIPWKTGVRGPGVAHAARQMIVYPPYPSVVGSIRTSGRVEAGDLLAQLDAPDLRFQSVRNQARAQGLSAQLTGLQGQERGLDQASATVQRLGEQLAEVQATGEELGRLQLKAEFAGMWLDVNPQKQPGTWVNTREPLGIVIDPQHWLVDAYVGQDDIGGLAPGAGAVFYLDQSLEALRGTVVEIDTTRAARISYPMLATRHGGPIAIAAQSQELIPEDPRFRIRIELESAPTSLRETRGEVLIEGRRRSPLGEALRNLLAIVIRESGF
jgi:putative peptide zinc metalloprotease protein